MATATGAISAHKMKRMKRGSRNKKQNMRKHIDMAGVEDLIDEQRFQERTGGSVKTKSDKALFSMDTGVDVPSKPTKPLSRKAKARAKVLKADQVVAGNQHIKPVAKASGKTREFSLDRVLKEKRADRVAAKPKTATAVDDVWDHVEEDPTNGDPYLAHLVPGKPDVPDSIANPMPSSAPTVELQQAGQSYNPLYEDHQALLAAAVETELQEEERNKRWRAAAPKVGSKEQERIAMLRELRRGVDEFVRVDLEDVMASEDEEEAEAAPLQPVVRTRAQKLAEEKHKALNDQKAVAKQRKRQATDLDRIEAISNEMTKLARRQARKVAVKRAQKAERALNPRQLSKYNHSESKLDLKTTDELVGSLRQLQPEGSLVKDRLRSFQRRNILEYRIHASQRRRYPVKWITNRAHKNFDLNLRIKHEAAAKAAKRAEKQAKHAALAPAAKTTTGKTKTKRRKVKRKE
eukprot:m.89136 g.89136  ORF g.89136 m.89136 type:complete len:462 (-) comp14851_c0_seq1:136-1521(-)